jgi:hypothetical protein
MLISLSWLLIVAISGSLATQRPREPGTYLKNLFEKQASIFRPILFASARGRASLLSSLENITASSINGLEAIVRFRRSPDFNCDYAIQEAILTALLGHYSAEESGAYPGLGDVIATLTKLRRIELSLLHSFSGLDDIVAHKCSILYSFRAVNDLDAISIGCNSASMRRLSMLISDKMAHLEKRLKLAINAATAFQLPHYCRRAFNLSQGLLHVPFLSPFTAIHSPLQIIPFPWQSPLETIRLMLHAVPKVVPRRKITNASDSYVYNIDRHHQTFAFHFLHLVFETAAAVHKIINLGIHEINENHVNVLMQLLMISRMLDDYLLEASGEMMAASVIRLAGHRKVYMVPSTAQAPSVISYGTLHDAFFISDCTSDLALHEFSALVPNCSAVQDIEILVHGRNSVNYIP